MDPLGKMNSATLPFVFLLTPKNVLLTNKYFALLAERILIKQIFDYEIRTKKPSEFNNIQTCVYIRVLTIN